jgi:hypothetical protein
MPGISVNDNGTVKAATGLHVNDAGTVKPVLEAWVNDAGTLKKFWPATPPLGPPSAPTNLNSTAQTGNSVSLAWTAAVANGTPVTGYEISYGTVASGAFASTKTVGVVTADTITGLAATTPYQFRIRANSAQGYGAYSDTLQVSTIAGAPAAPSISSSTSTASSVTVRVTVGAGTVPTQYVIQYGPAGTGTFSQGQTFPYTGSPQNCVVSVASNIAYEFYAVAQNGSGSSPQSNVAYNASGTSAPASSATLGVGDSNNGGFSDIGYAAGTPEYTGATPVGSISGTVNGKTWEQFQQIGATSYVLAVRGTGVTQGLFNRIVFNTKDANSGILYASDATFETGIGSDGTFSRWSWNNIAGGPAPTFVVGASIPLQLSY